VVGTVVLVVVAFVTDASSAPWLWRAVAAGGSVPTPSTRADRPPRPAPGTRHRAAARLGAAAAVSVLVAGYLGYVAAGGPRTPRPSGRRPRATARRPPPPSTP
jgi:hypothetical protein